MTSIRATGIIRDIVTMKAQIDTLQRQFATEKKAMDYAGLGVDRSLSLSSRAKLSEVQSFEQSITDVTVRIDVVQTSLTRFDAIAREQRAANLEPKLMHVNGRQTAAQLGAEGRLDEVIAMLNQNVNGRHPFSGRSSEAPAVATRRELLEGQAPKVGLIDLIAERRRADLGADGQGRTATTRVTDTVSFVDTVGPFGSKIAGMVSNLSNVSVTDSAGPAPRTLAFAFAGQPEPSQTARVTLDMPDGTKQAITMTATRDAIDAPGHFQIGATPTDTAVNFETALRREAERIGRTSLVAASARAAADDFFENPPRRMATPSTPETATAYEAASSDSIVVWYRGERGTDDPRATATARIDRNVTIGYGVRATEDGIRELVAGLATFAATRFDPASATDREAYDALAVATRVGLSTEGGNGMIAIQSTIAIAQASIQSAKERHEGERAVLHDLLQTAEGVSKEEIATQILALQTRLQGSYQTTAMISRLSLVNYL